MANPTTNFGWQMPEPTDLVTDLPADFEVFGQAVDTDFVDLLGGTTGQVLAKASNADLDFVWSADAAGMTNPMTTTGDSIYSSSGSTPARLGIGSAGQVLTVASGIPSWATPAVPAGFVGAVVYKSANQSIPNTTWTLATWDSEVLDTDAFHDGSTNNDRLTIPAGKAGKYVVSMNWVLNGGASAVESYFGKNGSGMTLTYIGATADGNTKPVAVTRQIYLDLIVGDWINMSVLQASGGSADLLGTIGNSYFSLQYLGA
jgi:hypothetical protein